MNYLRQARPDQPNNIISNANIDVRFLSRVILQLHIMSKKIYMKLVSDIYHEGPYIQGIDLEERYIYIYLQIYI